MENVILVDIETELKTSYINYAMSVIVSRAIPDVRDGLKPVHRRIMYSMNEMGLKSNTAYKKCGRIVGDVLGKYHPHGDAAIYDSLVRMAQPFSLRYMAVDGHGNFGSVDGDPPAAMRYTESRMSKIAELMLKDIKKETIDYRPNYDDSMTEPVMLPAAVPFLLINGASGIAVGMSTNIPPYNLKEVVDAILMQIDNPEVTPEELMTAMTGPDFPTGGIIHGQQQILRAYKTGRGTITVRAKTDMEETANGKMRIIVTEIPYQIKKADLIIKIADLVKNNKITGVSDVRDESDRTGMRIVIELKKSAIPKVVMNQLYSHTALQSNFGIINLALVDGVPKVLSLKETIKEYIVFRKTVIYRRTKYELRKAEERAHILEGLLIALDNLDEVIRIIRASKDRHEALPLLMDKFGLSEIQGNAILDMRLYQLTNLESSKLQDEYDELMKLIEKLKEILSSDENVLKVVRQELIDDCTPFFDERRTKIVGKSIESFDVEDLIEDEDMIIMMTHKGFIKRVPLEDFKTQGRGGVGVNTSSLRDDDFVEHMFVASTHQYLLFFTQSGLVYKLKVHEIPKLGKSARGEVIKLLLGISPDDDITNIVSIKDFNDENQNILIATMSGVIKKVALQEFERVNQNGKRAISLTDDNQVVDVKITSGDDEILITTRKGKALRYHEKEVRRTGRQSQGVTGIKLMDGDKLCGICLINDESEMVMMTENGYGKRVDVDEFQPHGRATGGQRYYKYSEEKGEVISVKQVFEGEDIMAITSRGLIIRIASENISKQGRNASGVRLVRITKPDTVVTMSRTPRKSDKES